MELIPQVLGKQLVLDLYGCRSELISRTEYVAAEMHNAALACGATIVKEVFHQFNPAGVSGVIVISESHFAIHTWPEHGYCAVDLFTCSPDIEEEKAFEHLKRVFHAESMAVREIQRPGELHER